MRLIITLLALYGLRLSRTASSNIRHVHREAEAGDRRAAQHFTETRYARLFGPPNSDLGTVYYALAGLCAVTGIIRNRTVLTVLRLASAATVVVSLYLLWALLFRLRVRCTICIKGHIVNAAIFVTLLGSKG
jgi:uncharacterized membrane protein